MAFERDMEKKLQEKMRSNMTHTARQFDANCNNLPYMFQHVTATEKNLYLNYIVRPAYSRYRF